MMHSLISLPKRAFGASEQMRTEGIYNPEPIVEAATLPIGTGGIAGVPLKSGEVALGSGILRPKPPPMVCVIHGTPVPTEYSRAKNPPPTHDLGTHVSVDPSITSGYALAGVGPNKQRWVPTPEEMAAAGPRNKPFLGDFRSALRYPQDAIKWNEPTNVINLLQDEMRKGFKAPRGLLEDLHNIGKSEDVWQRDLIPMLQKRGHDSLFYPHVSENVVGNRKKYNTFMSFDPENQLIPRYSPEGQKLIQERGVRNPIEYGATAENWGPDFSKHDSMKWSVPRGVLHKPTEIETLRKLPKENTAKWWEDSSSGMGKIHEDMVQKELNAAQDQAKINQQSKVYHENYLKIGAIYDDLKSGKMTPEQFKEFHGEVWKSPPPGKYAYTFPTQQAKEEYFSKASLPMLENHLKTGILSADDFFKYSPNASKTIPTITSPVDVHKAELKHQAYNAHKNGEITQQDLSSLNQAINAVSPEFFMENYHGKSIKDLFKK